MKLSKTDVVRSHGHLSYALPPAVYSVAESDVICVVKYWCFNLDMWYSTYHNVSVCSYTICKIDNQMQMIAEKKTLLSSASTKEDSSWVKMEMASMHQSDRISIALKYTSASGCSHESCKLHQIRVPSIPQRLCHMPTHWKGKESRWCVSLPCSNSWECWPYANCQRNEVAIHLQLLWCINLIEMCCLLVSCFRAALKLLQIEFLCIPQGP